MFVSVRGGWTGSVWLSVGWIRGMQECTELVCLYASRWGQIDGFQWQLSTQMSDASLV